MNERELDILRKARNGELDATIKRVRDERAPRLDLPTLQKAHSASGKMLAGERADEADLDGLIFVVTKMQPKRTPTSTEVSLFATWRDGTETERESVRAVLKEAARVARQTQPDTFFTVAKTRTGKLAGQFFRV